MMYLSYAGKAIYVDTYHEAAAWLERHHALEEIQESLFHVPQFARTQHLSQPTHGYPPRPRLKIGQWFYPWGLSRWGEMTVIVSKEWLDDLGETTTGELKITSEEEDLWEFKTEMYMLPPRPVSSFGFSANDAYLVTFVDSRYFLRWVGLVPGGIPGAEWSDLYGACATAMNAGNFGTLTYDSIHASYLKPSGHSDLDGRSSVVAGYADAVAFNCGQRIVRKLDGTYHADSVDTSTETYEANISTHSGKRRAGGEIELNATALPENVRVHFTKATGHIYDGCGDLSSYPLPKNQGEWYTKSVPVSEYDGEGMPGTNLDCYDTAVAQYSYDEEGSLGEDPDNQTDLDNLAGKITEAYVGWRLKACDLTSNYLKWTPDGFTDLIIEFSGTDARLRARTMPLNFDVREYCHFTSGAKSKIGIFTGTTTETLDAFTGSGLVQITNFGVEEEEYIVEVFNPWGAEVDEGKQIAFAWNNLACHFEVIAEDCPE